MIGSCAKKKQNQRKKKWGCWTWVPEDTNHDGKDIYTQGSLNKCASNEDCGVEHQRDAGTVRRNLGIVLTVPV
jgi:hypothetical protein